ncbi:hypothetical protein C2G38_2142247 [Gigaspora rosea]|uniref:TLDc domain-containing protein n=1 Tax=Gigaspora rosea TaxID=44941 RepID=A0A397VA42_9GLOM|nr:hypothetical protein C2G38_2142247 [Gigaspora rosea]
MLIAYEFLFEELAKHLETHLIEKEAHWLRLNFTRIYQKSFQNNKFQELQRWCNDFLVKYPSKIFDSEEFISLQENALISLISRDDLQMEEVKIWNHVIEWGIAQNPDLPSDPEEWSLENFLALKTTLQNCLPHIRYFQMSGDDIFNYVQPYQPIFEKKLWKDITKKFMTNQPITSTVLPPRVILTPTLPTRIAESFESFSNVINETHAAEIASWVDRKANPYFVRDNPYEFKLLLRGTRDGFTKDSFWNLCDKQTHLVVVMKVKGTVEILGGYNPVGWDKPSTKKSAFSKNCNNSFVFSLRNGTIQNSILSRVKPERAIGCNSYCGPIFGSAWSFFNVGVLAMNDNFNQDNGYYCRNTHEYEKPIRNEFTYNKNGYSYFSVKEYEIFQINKKP